MSFDKQHVMGAAAEASEPALVCDQAPSGLAPTGFDQAQELLPCPFCASAELRVAWLRATDEVQFWRVECVTCDCFLGGPSADTEAEAVRLWNNRLALVASSRQEERLREALDRQCDAMAFVLNRIELPEQWSEKFTRELIEDRAVLSPPHAKDAADV